MRKFKISKNSGSLDVWSLFLNTDNLHWVVIRDLDKNRMYFGSIRSFSDGEFLEIREIILENVIVYKEKTESGKEEELYKTDLKYLSFDSKSNIIRVL